MKKIELKNKVKNEKGSITIFVLASMIFFLVILVSIYVNNVNKGTNMGKYINKTESNYEVTNDNLEQAYQETIGTLYTPVQYIESSGTQFINTGYNPTPNTRVEIELSFHGTYSPANYPGDGRNNRAIMGSYDTEADCFTCNFGDSGQSNIIYYWLKERYRSGVPIYSGTYSNDILNNRNMMILESGHVSYAGMERTAAVTVNDTEAPFTIFARSRYDVGEDENDIFGAYKMRVYSCKIYDGDTLVRDFIPVLNADGEACLYDKVEPKFYYNQGTGEFDFEPEYEYTPVEYLESTGTQYIDTRVIANDVDTIKMQFNLTQNNTTIQGIMGGGWSSNNKTYQLIRNGANIVLRYGETVLNFPYDNAIHNVELTRNKLKIDNTEQNNSSEVNDTRSVCLFVRRLDNLGNGVQHVAYCKIYSCQIYDDDGLVRDFIPVLDPDGVACLYDKVTGEYYYNSGTGTFKTDLDE